MSNWKRNFHTGAYYAPKYFLEEWRFQKSVIDGFAFNPLKMRFSTHLFSLDSFWMWLSLNFSGIMGQKYKSSIKSKIWHYFFFHSFSIFLAERCRENKYARYSWYITPTTLNIFVYLGHLYVFVVQGIITVFSMNICTCHMCQSHQEFCKILHQSCFKSTDWVNHKCRQQQLQFLFPRAIHNAHCPPQLQYSDDTFSLVLD